VDFEISFAFDFERIAFRFPEYCQIALLQLHVFGANHFRHLQGQQFHHLLVDCPHPGVAVASGSARHPVVVGFEGDVDEAWRRLDGRTVHSDQTETEAVQIRILSEMR